MLGKSSNRQSLWGPGPIMNVRCKLAEEFSAGDPCIRAKKELTMPANYIGYRHHIDLDRWKYSDVRQYVALDAIQLVQKTCFIESSP